MNRHCWFFQFELPSFRDSWNFGVFSQATDALEFCQLQVSLVIENVQKSEERLDLMQEELQDLYKSMNKLEMVSVFNR